MTPYTPDLRRQPTSSNASSTSSSNQQNNNNNNNGQQNNQQRFSIGNRSSEDSQPSSSSLASAISGDPSDGWRRVKCVLIGDAAVGKTSLIVSYTTDGYPQEYVPTAFDNYSVLVRVDGQPVKVQLCDTAGQDDFDTLRPLCYPNTDVFLLCFSVINPSSFENVRQRWVQELRQCAPDTPFLLIGTESDLRTNIKILIDLSRHNRSPIAAPEARRLAQEIGAIRYIECSSLTQQNLKEAFDSAILAALKLPNGDDQTRVQMHEFRGRKSLRKWKNKLVTRSNSADSMKHLKIKRSASNNNGKMSNAQSIGRLNYYGQDSPVPHGKHHHARPSYAEALSGHGMLSVGASCVSKKDGKEGKKKFSLTNGSTSNHSIATTSIKANGELNDLSKAKKGWKKLFCVV